MLGQGPKRRPATETKQCPYCGNSFNVRGYGRHEQACRSRQGQGSTPAFNADDAIHSLIENGVFHICFLQRKSNFRLYRPGADLGVPA